MMVAEVTLESFKNVAPKVNGLERLRHTGLDPTSIQPGLRR